MANPYVIRLSWRNLAVTLVLAAVLWGTPFAVWPFLAFRKDKRPAYAPPVVRFMGTFQGVDGSVWSPVVFPLPTKYGFSETVDAPGGEHDVSVLMRPREFGGIFLDVEGPMVERAVLGSLDGPDAPRGCRPAGIEESVFRSSVQKGGSGWLADVDPVLEARKYLVDLSGVGGSAVPGQSGVDAYVELDLRGYPLHVLLEGSTGNTALDQALVKALYSGRGERGGAGESGRIHVYYREAAGVRSGDGKNGVDTGGRNQQGR